MASQTRTRYALVLEPAEFRRQGASWLERVATLPDVGVVGGSGRRAIVEATPSAIERLQHLFGRSVTVEALAPRSTRR